MSNEEAEGTEGGGGDKAKMTAKPEDAVAVAVGDKEAGASTQGSEKAPETEPFALRSIDISIPRGTLCRFIVLASS
jgi:hypothetical protein